MSCIAKLNTNLYEDFFNLFENIHTVALPNTAVMPDSCTLPWALPGNRTLPRALPHAAAHTAAHCRNAAHYHTLPRTSALSHTAALLDNRTVPQTAAAHAAVHCMN
jgi:hypothetical protein